METVFSRCFGSLFFTWLLLKLSTTSLLLFFFLSSCSWSSRFRLASASCSGPGASLRRAFLLSSLCSLTVIVSWTTSGFWSFGSWISALISEIWILASLMASADADSLIREPLLSFVSSGLLRLSFLWVCGESERLLLSPLLLLFFLFSCLREDRLVFSPEWDWEPWEDNQPREKSFSKSFAEGSPATHTHTGNVFR